MCGALCSHACAPRRFVHSRRSAHDFVVATIKRQSFPLQHLSFVNRQIAYATAPSHYTLLSASIPKPRDLSFGPSPRSLHQLSFSSLATFTPITPTGTRLEYTSTNDHRAATLAHHCRTRFQRDLMIDEEIRQLHAARIESETQTYDEGELKLLEEAVQRLTVPETMVFTKYDSPDPEVRMQVRRRRRASHPSTPLRAPARPFVAHVADSHTSFVARLQYCDKNSNGRDAIITAETTIHASPAASVAWECHLNSRANIESHIRDGGRERDIIPINEHSFIFRFVLDIVPGVVTPREWVMKCIWQKRPDNSFLLLYVSVDHDKYPRGSSPYVRAEALSTTTYTPNDKFGVAATDLKYLTVNSFGGIIPRKATVIFGLDFLMFLSQMRTDHDQSPLIETLQAARTQEVVSANDGARNYSEEEEQFCAHALSCFAIFETTDSKPFPYPSPLVSASLARSAGEATVWGRCSFTVRAPPATILAYQWGVHVKANYTSEGLRVVSEINDHHKINYRSTPLGQISKKVLSDRDFLMHQVWKKISHPLNSKLQCFILLNCDAVHEDYPPSSKIVRASYTSCLKFTAIDEATTRVEFVTHPKLFGSIPSWVIKPLITPLFNNVTRIQESFQRIRELSEYDAEDGASLGALLVLRIPEEKKSLFKGEDQFDTRMRHIFDKHKALVSLSEQHEFFRPMIAAMVRNKLRPPVEVGMRLCNVSPKEGKNIGQR